MIQPMLAKDAKKVAWVNATIPEDADGWTQEPKLDGWRFVWHQTAEGVDAYGGRNGADHSGDPGAQPIRQALAFLPEDTILDSELIAEGGDAPLVGSALAGTVRGRAYHLRACVFDLLRLGGHDVTQLPWSERRRLLAALSGHFDVENVALVPTYDPSRELYESWIQNGLEGAVLKKVDSTYRPGVRTVDWLKFKPQQTTEALVIGVEDGKGQYNAADIGAFTIRLLDTGEETSTATPPEFCNREAAEAQVGRVLEIRHHGWTKDGVVKHPVFHRMRPDRDPVPA